MPNIKKRTNKDGSFSYKITISKRLGHAKVSTTTDIYSHIIQQADEQAADKIAETIFRAGKKEIG